MPGALEQELACLYVLRGPSAGTLLEVRSRTVAGRDPSCDMVLPEAGISREHAIFQDDGNTLTVSDIASTNGTFVNGEQIHEPTSLKEGDVVKMGGCELEYVGRKPEAEFPSYRDTRENIPVEMTRSAGRYDGQPSRPTANLKKARG